MVFKGPETRDNITCRTISRKSRQSPHLNHLHKYPNRNLILFVTLEKLLGVARTLVILLSFDWRYGYTLR